MPTQEQALRVRYANHSLKQLEDMLSADKGQLKRNNSHAYVSRKRIPTLERMIAERKGYASAPEPKPTIKPDDNEPLDVIVSRKHIQIYQSAMKRGKEFNLSHTDIKRLLTRKTCAYTGVKLTRRTEHSKLPTDRTIDRIDPSKGYVQGNVVAVSDLANQIKNKLFESDASTLRTDVETVAKLCASLVKIGFKG